MQRPCSSSPRAALQLVRCGAFPEAVLSGLAAVKGLLALPEAGTAAPGAPQAQPAPVITLLLQSEDGGEALLRAIVTLHTLAVCDGAAWYGSAAAGVPAYHLRRDTRDLLHAVLTLPKVAHCGSAERRLAQAAACAVLRAQLLDTFSREVAGGLTAL